MPIAASKPADRLAEFSNRWMVKLWFHYFARSSEFANNPWGLTADFGWMSLTEARARTWVHPGVLQSPIGDTPSSVPLIVQVHTAHLGSELLAASRSLKSWLAMWPSSGSPPWGAMRTRSLVLRNQSSAPAASFRFRPSREIPTLKTRARAISLLVVSGRPTRLPSFVGTRADTSATS